MQMNRVKITEVSFSIPFSLWEQSGVGAMLHEPSTQTSANLAASYQLPPFPIWLLLL